MTAETQMSTPLQPAPPSPLRASDAEREATVARLHQALAEGRLDLAETEERVTAAYAARHRDESCPRCWPTCPRRCRRRATRRGGTSCGCPSCGGRAARSSGRRSAPAGQCRSAAWLVVLAVAWMALCALVGAAVVS